jgi:hypothetical protein
MRIFQSALLLVLLAGCSLDEGMITLTVDGSRLEYHEGGWIDIVDEEGKEILVHGTAVVTLGSLGSSGTQISSDAPRERSIEMKEETDVLGRAVRLLVTVTGEGSEPDMIWTISAYPDGGFYTLRVTLRNETGQAVRAAKISVLRVHNEAGGGLFLGQDPSRHRILDNGSLTVFDYLVEVMPGDVRRNDVLAQSVPGSFGGQSASNWNHAVVDLDGTRTWVAGALTFARSMPVLNLSAFSDVIVEAPDGRHGFAFFSAEAAYLPEPRPVAAGESLDSELYYVHPGEKDALAGLERYAERVAIYLGIVPWTRRDGGKPVPNGWNSWTGSGGTGGYGTDINEALMLENLDVMATELRDWGMDYFQVDDGYQPAYGDWWFREDRFPHGPAWLTDQIRARGLKPGLWMAPFTPDPESQLAQDHPDWIADWTLIGSVIGGDDDILDLTHPEVQAYLHELFDRFRNEWGFEWFKMDFAYWALLGTGFYDPAMTREEAWHQALAIIREELGPDVFFLSVSATAVSYEHCDAMRLTLDSQPLWDWEPTVDAHDHLHQQGLKATVRNAGRRWYLQDRIWINHSDLIFFRSNPNDLTWPRLTLQESQAFCTYVGLSGGIVKLGDKLVDLDGDAINTIRTLLPGYGRAARPVDVFTREYPEVWLLPVEPLDGYEEPFTLLGLFNWGFNVDMSTTPYTDIPDDGGPREHEVNLAGLGVGGPWLAYEFWTQEFLGEVGGELSLSVPSHTGRVVALRRPTGVPQFLGWNRQITMGGKLVEEVAWDDESRQLTFRCKAAAPGEGEPFTYMIAFYVPEGFSYSTMETLGVPLQDLAAAQEDRVLRVSFVPASTGDLEIVMQF